MRWVSYINRGQAYGLMDLQVAADSALPHWYTFGFRVDAGALSRR